VAGFMSARPKDGWRQSLDRMNYHTDKGLTWVQSAKWRVVRAECPVNSAQSDRSFVPPLRVKSISLSAVRCFHKNLGHVSAPLFKRNPTLVEKFVALVNSGNA
jgi:hypothetical protein